MHALWKENNFKHIAKDPLLAEISVIEIMTF